MKYLSLFFLLLSLCFSSLHAQSCAHSRGRTQNYLLPDLSFSCIPKEIGENSGVAFLAEGGRRNFRFNGTYGVLIDNENKFKISAEYLLQKLGYNFSPGRVNRWVRQYAIGAAYGVDFSNFFIVSGEISGYFSHAANCHLSDAVCEGMHFKRRIAGSYAYGAEASATVALWPCGFLLLDAIYDSVDYQRIYHSRKHVKGFGGSVGFTQQFDGLGFDLKAEFRRPFNYYRTGLRWFPSECSGMSVGVYASHVQGKYHLPSNTTAGLEITYTFSDLFSPSSFCEKESCEQICCVSSQLRCWLAKPAVYMPQVLAIAEERFCSIPCALPTSTAIPPFSTCASGPYSYDVSPFFTNPSGSQPLVFSATGLPAGAVIDPATGVISGTNIADTNTYNVTVSAANGCGSTSQPLTMSFTCPAPTSTPIPNTNIALLPGTPYTLDVSSFFTTPCGQPFTFSATGLPVGSSISPTTGVISGQSIGSGPAFNVTVIGTTECGQTQQSFQLTFNSVFL